MLLAMILELLGRLINSTGVTVAAAAAVGAVISDGVLTPGVRLGVVRREAPARMAVGVPAAVRVTIGAHNRRRFGSRRPVVVVDRLPGVEPGRIVTPRLAARQSAVAERLALPVRRGVWAAGGALDIEAFSPLGGFVRRATIEVPGKYWVHPRPLPPLPMPEPVTGRADGAAATRRAGSGTEFFAVREWRAGDPANLVHWRASARRDHLVVLEREREGRPTFLVVVDTVPAAQVDAAEADLARAAATAVRALRSGQSVVLVTGSTVRAPTRPRDLLDDFAAVQWRPADPATVEAAIVGARGGATLLWVGGGLPATVERQARAAGVITLALGPCAVSAGGRRTAR
jgi:uncharacterized protein (DUF58 family)